MSWQITVNGVHRDDAEDKIDEAAEAYWPNVNPNALEEAQEQFEAAKLAAIALLTRMQTGAPDEAVCIHLAGHANPGHGLNNGLAKESITANVFGQV